MTTADGASGALYLRGAQLTSWVPAGSSEWLFMSERASFADDALTLGGISLLFPQPEERCFSGLLDWSLVRVSQTEPSVTALLRLTDSRATRRSWRQRFQLGLLINLGGAKLSLQWHLKNTGQQPLQFTAAVRQHLRLADGIPAASLLGLEEQQHGSRSATALAPAALPGQQRAYSVPPRLPLLLRDGSRTVKITGQNLPDLEVWNPHQEAAAQRLDLAPDEIDRFLRLQAGSGKQPLDLQPGELWRSELVFSADQTPPQLSK